MDASEETAGTGGSAPGAGPESDAELARKRGAGLIEALEAHMPTAAARSEIAATLALAVARRAACPEPELIAEAARLREVGKLYMPKELLYTPETDLDPTAKAHAASYYEQGEALAAGAGVAERACGWILNAQERWDGSGPAGLAGVEIPAGSRVIAVCRTYLDAPHTSGTDDPRAAALELLRELAGSILDPRLATIGVELAGPGPEPELAVRERREQDLPAIESCLEAENAMQIARNGELVDPLGHSMLVAASGSAPGGIAGLLSWIDGEEAEILAVHARPPRQGTGTALLEALARRAAELGRKRLIVTTTNDNLHALRFYQRRGFRLRAVRIGEVERSRARLKPSIPVNGEHGIELRDELELERAL